MFFGLPWFTHLAASGLEGDALLRLYGVREKDDGNTVLMLPMRELSARYGVRRLEGLSNWYSSLYGIVGEVQANRHQAISALVAAIAAERPRWDVLDLHPLDPADPSFAALLQALNAAGMATQRYFCFHNWYLDVAGRCYDDYAAGLPSRLKNTLKRKGRQLEKSGRARFDIVTGGEQLESAIAAYEKVYAASWKSPEPSPEFMPGLMRLCAGQGWLRLGIATVDGEPAAAQLWIACAGVASIYKLAYDERFASLSVGSLLTERLMRHVIDIDRVREVDYLTGDDAYKRDWMSHSRERCGIIAFNLRSVRGIAAAIVHLGGGWLKTGLRRLRGGAVAP
ncbi:GNAT family N-acetyltransferase|uniref:GNAT family N-acetyltransferase n=1 Tax=Noviherbaspirillum sp. L7-7A TaxID=2850560 RepID=UPI001C2C7309|nr:GNAT family N-acetyltransferase [Noviherbaspirillum sp. L7-7A]MBV0879087.1 GNAT family N-acetyltransferase [Noviherbaspirillum sp. L7-7A]